MNTTIKSDTSVKSPSLPATVAPNTNPPASSVSPAAAASTDVTPTLEQLRANLKAQQEKLHLQQLLVERVEQEEQEKLQERRLVIIRELPGSLGLPPGELQAVVQMIRKYMIGAIRHGRSSNSASSSGQHRAPANKRRKAGGTEAFPDSVKKTALTMRKAGDTASEISRRLKVSEPTLWKWFGKAGLVHKGIGGKGRKGVKRSSKAAESNLQPVAAAPTTDAGTVAPVAQAA